MRGKIAKKIMDIIKKEEQAAKKIIDEDEMDAINAENGTLLDEFYDGDDPDVLKTIGVKELNQTPTDLKSNPESPQLEFQKKESKSKLLDAIRKA